MITNKNNRRNKLVLLAALAVSGTVLEFFIFSAAGPFIRFGNLDLNFLLGPLIILLWLYILAAAIPILLVNRYTLLMSTSLQYLAMAVFTFLLFQRALLFSRLPVLSGHLNILNPLTESAPYLGLFWVGVGFQRISNLMITNSRGSHFHQPVMSMLGFSLIAFCAWKSLNIFAIYWAPLQDVGQVIGLSLAIMAVTRLTGYVNSTIPYLIYDPMKWALDHPVKLFWLCILLMFYFVFARPMLYSVAPYAYLVEWVVICFAGYQILNSVKGNLKTHYSRPSQDPDWKRHLQIVNQIDDEDFNRMVSLQEEFISSGNRRNLLLFLRQILVNNHIPDTYINELLEPVIEYADAPKRWYHRWFFKKRLIQFDRRRRTRVLEESMGRMKEVFNPPHYYQNGAAHERNTISGI